MDFKPPDLRGAQRTTVRLPAIHPHRQGPTERPDRAEIGMPVFDSEGVRLGTVEDSYGGIFRLSAPWEDYWLGYAAVAELIPGRSVTLKVRSEELDKHRVTVPRAS